MSRHMSWSGIRKQVREKFAPSLQKRLDVHITSYHRDDRAPGVDHRHLGRGWVTLDGKEILGCSGKAAPSGGMGGDRQELYEAVVEYLRLSIDSALTSESFIIRGLAMADGRLGKRRLRSLDVTAEYPFVAELYRLRCEVERVRPPDDSGEGGTP